MQPATQVWWFAAGRVLATVVVGLAAGWLIGNLWAGLAGALALHLTWVLSHLFRLEWWLRHRNYADPPDVGGVWGEIIAQVVRLHRRKRFHKQRFVQLMRRLQRSTAALPNGGAAAGAAQHRGPRAAHREPAARAGVRPLSRPPGLHQPGRHSSDELGEQLPVAAGRALWRGAAAAAGERCLAADASGSGAP